MVTLLLPYEVDRLLCWPPGQAEKLARRGKIEHVRLKPTGDIRFDRDRVAEILQTVPADCGSMKISRSTLGRDATGREVALAAH